MANNAQGLQKCETPNGNWTHLTLNGEHPVCDKTKDAVNVRDLEMNEAQVADVKKHGSTTLVGCYRCEKWRRAGYVRRSTYLAVAGLN